MLAQFGDVFFGCYVCGGDEDVICGEKRVYHQLLASHPSMVHFEKRESLFDFHYWAPEMIVFVFFGRQVDIGLIKNGCRIYEYMMILRFFCLLCRP